MESSDKAGEEASMSAQSVYSALGLSLEDVEALAQIPEHEISLETLPYLIMQLKAKRAEKATPATEAMTTSGEAAAAAAAAATEAAATEAAATEAAAAATEAAATEAAAAATEAAATEAAAAATEAAATEAAATEAAATEAAATEAAATEAAATDTEDGDKPEAEPNQANQDPETSEKPKEKRESPPPSSSSQVAYSQEHEQHGKGEGHRKTERENTGERRDSRSRKSSRESQSGDAVTPEENELDDKPTVYPHTCTLCKTESNGSKAWQSHIRGLRHAKARKEFMLSVDDSSRRGSRSSLPSKRSYSSERSTGDLSSPSGERFFHPPKPFTKVVVAKYPMGSMAVADMLALGKPFGTIVKHLIFPFKGFLEFSSHTEAKNMVTHYQTKPAFIKGQRISLCLSPTVEVIHPPEAYEPPSKRSKSSPPSVVCFSRVPQGKEAEDKVLDLAALFGDVRCSKFTEDKALIEMVDWRDADIMVKYYHSNPLRIQDRSVKVSLSSRSNLRESSLESSSSKKSESSKSHSSSSRHKSESSSSKSATRSSSKDKEKTNEKEKEGEKKEEKKEGEIKEGEETEMKDEEVENQEAAQVEEEASTEDKEGIAMETEKEKEEEEKEVKTGGVEPDDGEDQKKEEEEEKDESKGERGSEGDAEEQEDLDDMEFPENLDDFVTLDELDNTTGDLDSPETQEGKVVVVRPIRNEFKETRKKAMREALFKMATPFGEVVNFAISYYRHEALIELDSVAKACEMVNFYKSSKRSKLCGRPVTVSLCHAFNTIEGPSGRTLFISMLPHFKYSDKSLLRLARPFGKITAYCFNRVYGTCYIQMETVEAAEKMIQRYLPWPLKFYGTPLKITKCRKGDSLIPWTPVDKFEHWYEPKLGRNIDDRRENGQTARHSSGEDRQSPVSSSEGVCGDTAGDEDSEEEEKNQTPLGPYQPDHPVGISYVVPKSGFFCKLCNVFYTDEKKAKSAHCSSLEHYNMLKKKRGELTEEEQTDGQTDG